MKGKFKVYFRKYPTTLLTRKSTGHRMGKGKGKFSARIAKFKKGEIIMEIGYIDMGIFDVYYKALIKALPVKVVAVPRSPAILEACETSSHDVKSFKRKIRRKSRRAAYRK